MKKQRLWSSPVMLLRRILVMLTSWLVRQLQMPFIKYRSMPL